MMHRANAKPQMARSLAAVASTSLLIIAAIFGFLLWSGYQVNDSSHKRDRSIVANALSDNIERAAHAQESSTVWDLAVQKLRDRPLDYKWIDRNLGTGFKTYAGHDEVYILGSDGTALYAMANGRRLAPDTYRSISEVVAPLVNELRGLSQPTHQDEGKIAMLSPGAADLAIVHGRPAIVSVKPVVSDSGEIVQRPGTEAVHISVVYLDGSFLSRLSAQYGLAGARYSRRGPAGHEAAFLLRTRGGRSIGYYVWRPFAPGNAITWHVAPVLLITLVLAGAVIFFLAHRLSRNQMDLQLNKAQARHLALHDGLTGLPNRAMFEKRLDEALAWSQREHSRLALLYLDLDRFKQVNDSLGHPAGDELIREVARRLTAETRKHNTVARLCGDEFGIILLNPGDRATIEEIAARTIADLGRPFDFMGVQSFIGVSIGIALAPDDSKERTELVRKADIALYKAKSEGRGRSEFFCPTMDEAVRTREALLRELRGAIAGGDEQMLLHYQPVFCSRRGTMTAVEALLRWKHPIRGLVSPSTFIGIAEESGLIEALGRWVLRTAVHDALHWPRLRLSINVSPIQLRNASFADDVFALLAETGMKPSRLELEITETALMDRSSTVTETLARLRTAGVAMALDDFGTGYSSLSHIRDIAVDRIKIDRSFVTAIEMGNGASLIRAIVTLAHANGLCLTAEGVETPRQRQLLEQMGCEELQGYLLSPPVPAGEITARSTAGTNVHSIKDSLRAA